MNLFESINESTTNAIKSGENYIRRSEEYFKLKIFQQLALSLSAIVKMAIVGGFVFLGLVFLAIAGAIALGKVMGSMTLGVLVVGIVLLLIALLAFALRKKFDQLLLQKFSQSFFD